MKGSLKNMTQALAETSHILQVKGKKGKVIPVQAMEALRDVRG
jgi:hypothetical protein